MKASKRTSSRPSKRKGFTNATRGKPLMTAKGWDGTAADKARIETLRNSAKGTYSIVSAAAACDRSLGKVTPFTVLALLGKYRNPKTTECFPSHATLARRLGITRRSVQRHIEKLMAGGYLVILPRRGAEGQTSNAYVMLFPPMAEVEQEDNAGDDEADEVGQEVRTAQETPHLPASEDGATLSVAGGVTEPEKPHDPLRHGVPDPATDGDAPCDMPCRTNVPTGNGPSDNSPSAEAGAAAPKKARSKLGNRVYALARASGLTEAAFMPLIDKWRAGLIASGLDAAAAEETLAWELGRIPKTAFAFTALEERIAEHLPSVRPSGGGIFGHGGGVASVSLQSRRNAHPAAQNLADLARFWSISAVTQRLLRNRAESPQLTYGILAVP